MHGFAILIRPKAKPSWKHGRRLLTGLPVVDCRIQLRLDFALATLARVCGQEPWKRVINEWQETQNGCPVTANGAGLTHRKHRHEMGGDAMSRALIWSSEERRGSRRSAEGMKELQRRQRGSKRNLHSRLTIATVRTDFR